MLSLLVFLATALHCPEAWPQATTGAAAEPLAAYQGQNVSGVELAGRPDVNRLQGLQSLIVQRPGEPFSQQKVLQTVAALRQYGHMPGVQLEIQPEPSGLQLYFILQPALYIGLLEFPGAVGRFSYSRLLQVANYPNQEPYAVSRVNQSQAALLNFLHHDGYFLATVNPVVDPDYRHGVVNVIFHIDLKRRAKFGAVDFTGVTPEEAAYLRNSLHSWHARLKNAVIKQGKKYSRKRVQSATAFLQSTLAKQGYLANNIRLPRSTYNPETNRADMIFEVNTGPRITVKVEGAGISGRAARHNIPMYQDNAYDTGLVREGQRNLVSYYQGKGYFDAQVSSDIQETPTGILVLYHVTPGKRYRVESIAFRGNHHFSAKQLRSHLTISKAHLPMFSHGTFNDKLLDTSVKNITAVYQDAGFSQVSVTPVLHRDPNLSVIFQINEGEQDRVATLQVQGNKTVPLSTLAHDGLQLGPGKAYSQRLLEQDRNQIMATYLNMGYLTANFQSAVHPLPNDPHQLQVTYTITEGQQVHAASVVTVGAVHTSPQTIDRMVKVHPGQPLSEREMFGSENRLYNLGVFDWATVGPRTPAGSQPAAEVVVKLHESKRNVITYGFGFEVINRGGNVPGGTVALPGLPPVGLPTSFQTSQKTFWGPRGSIEYTRKNLRGKGESLTIGALGARLDQRGSITYAQPSFRNSSWSTTTSISGERTSENPIFTARLGEAGTQFQRYLDRRKTMTVFFKYSYRKTVLSNLLIPDLVLPEDRNVRLSTFSGSFTRDTRDNPLDAHHGIYQSFDMGITPTLLGSSANFARMLGQTAYYKPFGSLVWANSLRLGLEQPFSNSHIPLSEEFFSGGGSTLRGFPLNGAGPQRVVPVCSNPAVPSTCTQIQVPVGGPQLFILNSELRFPIPVKKGLGGVAFYDGGNVYQHVGFHDFISNYTNTVGVGLRYQTPVGPVRIDLGHNLNPIPGVKATQIFVTLGQAF